MAAVQGRPASTRPRAPNQLAISPAGSPIDGSPFTLADSEFRLAALSTLEVVMPLVGVGVGLGALVGVGGSFIARDLASHRLQVR